MADADAFTWPPHYSFPPFFTRQPNAETNARRVQMWKDLILDYCRHHRQFVLSVREAVATSPLFGNAAIARRLQPADANEILCLPSPPPAGAPPHLPKCFTPRLRLLLTSAAHIHAGTSWPQQVLPSGFQATETSSTSTGRCLCACDSACVYRTRERKIKESERERKRAGGGIRAMHACAHVHTCTHTHTHTHNLFTYAHAGLNHRSGRTSSTSGLKRRET